MIIKLTQNGYSSSFKDPEKKVVRKAVTKKAARHRLPLVHHGTPAGEKLNANDYSTSLVGLKYKVAHKRADKNKWSAKTPTQTG